MRLALGLSVVALALVPLTLARAGTDNATKITATVKVSPNRAGTRAHPRGVKIDLRTTINIPGGYNPPLVKSMEIRLPKGVVFHGDRFPACVLKRLTRHGPSACPKRSIMGSSGANDDPNLPSVAFPRTVVVNGGSRRVYFWTVVRDPARVAVPIVAAIAPLRGSRRWSYRLRAKIPRRLQLIANVAVPLSRLRVVAGRDRWLATTSCPTDRRWRYSIAATLDTGQVVKHNGSTGCRR
jgi:hypothetical protein